MIIEKVSSVNLNDRLVLEMMSLQFNIEKPDGYWDNAVEALKQTKKKMLK